MRFQVPQFVDIEDKIVGPLTLKQFLHYVVAVMVLAPFWALVDLALFITLAIPVLGMAALFAHMRIYGQTLATMVSRALGFYFKGRFYLWQRGTILKPMRVGGAEFAVLPLGPERLPAMPALTAMAQTLETQGKLITEDIADPLLAEKGAKEGGEAEETRSLHVQEPAAEEKPPLEEDAPGTS